MLITNFSNYMEIWFDIVEVIQLFSCFIKIILKTFLKYYKHIQKNEWNEKKNQYELVRLCKLKWDQWNIWRDNGKRVDHDIYISSCNISSCRNSWKIYI